MEETEKCVNCGFCESVCPTLPSSGFNSIYGARGRVDLGKYVWRQYERDGKVNLDISSSFYSCLDCNACLQVCPAGVNAGRVSDLAKRLIVQRDVIPSTEENPLARMIVNLTLKFGNPLAVRERCADWSEGIEFDSSSTLLYTGNMFQLMSYSKSMVRLKEILGENTTRRLSGFISKHPSIMRMIPKLQNREIKRVMDKNLRSIVNLLKENGIRFSYLGTEEPYPGTFIHDLGYDDEFLKYANKVYDLLKAKGIKEIIVIDPHTYDLLRNVYPKFVKGFDISVSHYLDYVSTDLIKRSEIKTTLHEPCHLVRGGDGYGSPRDILIKVSNLQMPDKKGKNTFCCGGPDELLFTELTNKVSEERYSQLRQVGAEKIVTACPVCLVNLRKSGEVVEISQFLSELNG